MDDGRTSGLPRLSHFVLGLLAGVAVRCEVPLPLRFSSSTLAAILGLPDVLASQVDDDQQRTCEVDHRFTHVSYPLAMLQPWASHLDMQASPPPCLLGDGSAWSLFPCPTYVNIAKDCSSEKSWRKREREGRVVVGG